MQCHSTMCWHFGTEQFTIKVPRLKIFQETSLIFYLVDLPYDLSKTVEDTCMNSVCDRGVLR